MIETEFIEMEEQLQTMTCIGRRIYFDKHSIRKR